MAQVDNFPPNSNRAKSSKEVATKAETKEEIQPVVKGTVVKVKQPFLKRFGNVFLGDSAKDVVSYILFDVAIPALRDLAVDSAQQGIERAILGSGERGSRRGHGGNSTISYNRASSRRGPRRDYDVGRDRDRDRDRGRGRDRGKTQDVDDIYVDTIEDAESVVECLANRVQKYDYVTVKELYKLLGEPSTFVDASWGWYNLKRVSIRQTRNGYKIEMPDPEYIED